jgi:alpha-2-macroglobulin
MFGRSDYSRFVDGEFYTERAWALAALAEAGELDQAYAAELARRAQFLNLESMAQVLKTFARSSERPPLVSTLTQQLWEGVIFRLYQGRETYGGLQEKGASRSGLVLPSETRTLAEITRAVARLDPKQPRLGVLESALVTLGKGDGWGSTNANASALLALSEMVKPPFPAAARQSVRVPLDGKDQTLSLGPDAPVGNVVATGSGAGEVVLSSGPGAVARVETTYVPAADGSQAAPRSAGFVVARNLLRVKKGAPPERTPLTEPGTTQKLAVGDVVEEHVQVVNPQARHYVAVVVPLAAGMEPLNPRLATTPPEARQAGDRPRRHLGGERHVHRAARRMALAPRRPRADAPLAGPARPFPRRDRRWE